MLKILCTAAVGFALPLVGLANDHPAQAALLGMSELERKAAFSRVLVTSDQACGGGVQTLIDAKRFDLNNNAYWYLRCAGGEQYEVYIRPDATGSTHITRCSVLAKYGLSCPAALSDD